jgi:hypothetical protein
MKRIEINVQTGEEKVIDLTPEEVAVVEANAEAYKTKRDAENVANTLAETKKASGKQKLKDLGLTDDEISVLVG